MSDSLADSLLHKHETTIREALSHGARGEDPAVLLPAVYDQLRRLAQLELSRMRPGQTLQATALVHDAWLRIVDGANRDGSHDILFENRAHFVGAAIRAMRRILIDQARAKHALKRGGGAARSDDPFLIAAVIDPPVEDVLSLDEALSELEVHHARAAQVVQLRFFGGLGHEEIATLLAVSLAAVERDWRFARSWLQRRMRASLPEGDP